MYKGRPELLRLFFFDKAYQEDVNDALDHGILVANIAMRICKDLGYDEDFCIRIGDAGIVHDIGKLEIGTFLYGRRKDALRIEEIKYVRKHPTLGFEYLTKRKIEDNDFREIILHHHENYDGSGYPDNIKGSAIPLGSRILRVCDVYSALISERPYRAAFDKDTAMELMIDEVKNFDMPIFLSLMRVVHADDFDEILDFVADCNAKKIASYAKEDGK